jgi:hypothetical protein
VSQPRNLKPFVAIALLVALYVAAAMRPERPAAVPDVAEARDASVSTAAARPTPQATDNARVAPPVTSPRTHAPEAADVVVDDALAAGTFDQGHADRLRVAMVSMRPEQRRAIGERIERAVADGALSFDPEPLPR